MSFYVHKTTSKLASAVRSLKNIQGYSQVFFKPEIGTQASYFFFLLYNTVFKLYYSTALAQKPGHDNLFDLCKFRILQNGRFLTNQSPWKTGSQPYKKWNLYGYRNYSNSIDNWSMENWFAALQKRWNLHGYKKYSNSIDKAKFVFLLTGAH